MFLHYCYVKPMKGDWLLTRVLINFELVRIGKNLLRRILWKAYVLCQSKESKLSLSQLSCNSIHISACVYI
jgi:hypothetical protein